MGKNNEIMLLYAQKEQLRTVFLVLKALQRKKKRKNK